MLGGVGVTIDCTWLASGHGKGFTRHYTHIKESCCARYITGVSGVGKPKHADDDIQPGYVVIRVLNDNNTIIVIACDGLNCVYHNIIKVSGRTQYGHQCKRAAPGG